MAENSEDFVDINLDSIMDMNPDVLDEPDYLVKQEEVIGNNNNKKKRAQNEYFAEQEEVNNNISNYHKKKRAQREYTEEAKKFVSSLPKEKQKLYKLALAYPVSYINMNKYKKTGEIGSIGGTKRRRRHRSYKKRRSCKKRRTCKKRHSYKKRH